MAANIAAANIAAASIAAASIAAASIAAASIAERLFFGSRSHCFGGEVGAWWWRPWGAASDAAQLS